MTHLERYPGPLPFTSRVWPSSSIVWRGCTCHGVDESICSSPRLLPHGNEILSHLSALLDENGKLSGEIRDQEEVVRDSVQQARTLCTTTVSSFVQALANALPQYAANGMTDFSADPWWVSMTSYFKASLWLFAAVPGVPMRYLADEDGGTGKQRILDANEVEALASTAGCQEHVEVCLHVDCFCVLGTCTISVCPISRA